MEELLQNSLTAAPKLLGWKLVHETPEGRVSGFIVETEAYSQEDPASHTFRGPGKKNASMFEERGTIYVYFTYGMHYCVNVVTGDKGHGQGVLIRALEPVEGIELMQQNRGISDVANLTNGPGKLTQALGINREHNGQRLNEGAILLEPGLEPEQIVQTTRIGISKAVDQPWRFYTAGNRFVSRPAKL